MEWFRDLLWKEAWRPVGFVKFAGFSAGLLLFIVFMRMCEPGFVFGLDSANLLFHEAGHPVFGLLGSTMELYGGTLGQLVFPVVLIVYFRRQGLAVSCAAGWIWLFENFFNIARYMADARAQILDLVGGGGHDWNNIFTRWHVIRHDTAIANAVTAAGWAGIVLVWLWLAWRTYAGARKNAPAQDEVI